MKKMIIPFFGLLFFYHCSDSVRSLDKKDISKQENNWKLPRLPKELESGLLSAFPGALPSLEFSDSLIHFINRKFGISKEKMLVGVSTCVDDIIYTKNFHAHPEIKGPFHLGGLAGLPFTGVSGLEAFAHHIPEGGTMLLLVEPHIGYSAEKNWGYILRHEQLEVSTCCGALMGTLGKLAAGKLNGKITEEDYQGDQIAALALGHRKEILEDKDPIIALTKITSLEAEKQIREHVLEINMQHINFIIIITGVLINTDYSYTDYQYITHLMVYDTKKRSFIIEYKPGDTLK